MFLLIHVEKKKRKSSIIGTPGPPVRRSPWPTSGGATISISFLTLIKPRFLLSVLKFKVSDPFLQGPCVDISQCHSTRMKNQQRQVLDQLSGKSKQRHPESIISYPARSIDHILRRLSACYQLQTSNHPYAFFHKINIDLKHKFTRSWVVQWAKKKWEQGTNRFKNTLD